jgi:hypothetical protein
MLGTDHLLYVPTLALATTTKIGALQKLSGNTTDFLDGTNAFQNLASAIQPTIWSARLRSFNAIGNGNPTFEVDQRNVGNQLTFGAPGTAVSAFALDRWTMQKNGATLTLTTQQVAGSGNTIPGTNFRISSKQFNVALTASQATLAAGDYINLLQSVEGSQLRELINDVHSISLLVYSNQVMKFAVSIMDSNSTHTLSKLCSIPVANQWTLIQLPNLPVWTGSGNFPITPGTVGYYLQICLAAGATYMPPANDVWNAGNFMGAVGMTNFASLPTNTIFICGFVQHEPGAFCSTPIDCPFTQNYDDCLRYFCKSYNYGTKPGTASQPPGIKSFLVSSNLPTYIVGNTGFSVRMATTPNVNAYAYDGTGGAVTNVQSGANVGVSSVSGVGDSGFGAILVAPAQTAGAFFQAHYTADTGW